MRKTATEYTAEFRQSAIKLVQESDQPVSAIAKNLGVNVNTLHTWLTKARKSGSAQGGTTNKSTVQSPNEELIRLRREVKQLKEERDILKKAAAYFAAHGQ